MLGAGDRTGWGCGGRFRRSMFVVLFVTIDNQSKIKIMLQIGIRVSSQIRISEILFIHLCRSFGSANSLLVGSVTNCIVFLTGF